MHFTSSLVALSLVLPSFVSAHGYLASVTADGKNYNGGTPNNGQGPVRQVNTLSPVTSTQDKNLACGIGAHPVSDSATASPGSTVQFHWSGGGGGKWPHVVGPLMTYMASCNGPCSKFDASQAKWFKIAQSGKKDNAWTQQLGIHDGKPSTAKIPSDLAPGEYLIRNEIIALHNAISPGGAEFYPSCTQIKVTGNGNAEPGKTVSFPGAYDSSAPGLLFDPYTPGGGSYQFPGPSVSKLAGHRASVSVCGSDDDSTDSASEPARRALRFARNL